MTRRRRKIALWAAVMGAGGAAVTYPFLDKFTTPRTAGNVDGTAAEPGPGNRLVVDTNSKISISGGVLQFAADQAANDGVWWDIRLGRPVKFSLPNHTASVSGRIVFGFDTDRMGPSQHAIWLALPSSTLQIINNGTSISDVGAYSAAALYKIWAVMNGSGIDWFIQGGTQYSLITLLWRGVGGVTDCYPSHSGAKYSFVILC